MLPLLHTGSVKNVYGIKNESPYVFDFSNRYSIFDWGEMPDELADKGVALAYMSWLFFDLLESSQLWQNWEPSVNNSAALNSILARIKKDGLKTHLKRIVTNENSHTSQIEVSPVDIIRPEFKDGAWDYSNYENKPENTLVPLEMIFRFGVPAGSSLMKRVDNESYLKELGLAKKPSVGDKFEVPVVEFSTKLEPSDSYLTYAKSQKIAGLSDLEFQELLGTVQLLALRLKDIFSDIKIDLWDGKFEFAFGAKINEQREFILVDSIGPDELRLTYDGVSLSKENLRSFYRNSSWHMALEEAKDLAKARNIPDWKNICIQELNKSPEKLKTEYKEYAEGIYTALANKLGQHFKGTTLFKNSKTLEEVASFFKGI